MGAVTSLRCGGLAQQLLLQLCGCCCADGSCALDCALLPGGELAGGVAVGGSGGWGAAAGG